MKKSNILMILLVLLTFTYSCSSKGKEKASNDSFDPSLYMEKGKLVSQATFAVLSRNLQEALAEGGVENAISYCNLAASPLTDSIAREYDATIRRTSFLTRNPDNKPTDAEKKILKSFSEKKLAGQDLLPIVHQQDEKISFYAPILINNLCLQCHGILDNTLTAENYNFIKDHYPDDQATGYKEGELRGIWSISFEKPD